MELWNERVPMGDDDAITIVGENNLTNHAELQIPPKKIEVTGNGNQLRLASTADLSFFTIIVRGNNNIISIQPRAKLRGLVYVWGNKSSLKVGADTTAETVRFSVGARASISIGRDCMLSRNIEIRCSDEHPIYDLSNRQEINTGKDVTIGDHVWLGEGVRVIKGMSIASGSIVGTGSVVTKSLDEPNAIYAGAPARRIRSSVAWARKPSNIDWEKIDFTKSGQ